ASRAGEAPRAKLIRRSPAFQEESRATCFAVIGLGLEAPASLGSAYLGGLQEHPMEFGMFHEFPSLPGRSESEAFDEAMEQVDAAERLGLDVMWLAELHFEPRRSLLSAPLSIASAHAAHKDRHRRSGLAAPSSAATGRGGGHRRSVEPRQIDLRGRPQRGG